MASILDSVNQRTQLVGQNRLELLLFRLQGRQRYGINVFKVREVLQCPRLTALPHQSGLIRGVAHIRGQTISVIDLSAAIGGPITQNLDTAFIIITEYNRSVQGFLVSAVERIVNLNWEGVLPPPKGSGRSNYLTAVTELEEQLVEILDVEKILDEISPARAEVSDELVAELAPAAATRQTILVADDSAVARKQIQRALEPMGLDIIVVKDGLEALNKLKELAADCQDISEKLNLVVSDIEMPEMDGYTLTAEIRANPKLKSLSVILHTSLSGVFNQAMVQKVGANEFIAKFNPDELARTVNSYLVKTQGE
ncbi:chemotaxis protein CheV [Ferrimonas balearica]|uniref:chemotaxis protein CheV n=1 Tax=Ferrimonas balearica TaxID=44012 RepID=UPI001C59BC7B|nr:chemotaxis protein CheV [Ferrimonas balearica]MBW3140147.1 chemotaxis protein CheV [Ferrimonas balearica]MBW3165167.1 chemotaxis protein CheV [Ferrimonas balearica]MBY5979968.1 chemotaxis protein CheV [Ferrimonas balearica]MBY6224698.1 chemotaxis protein CheV [Ferrimonas balearica]